MKLKSYIIWFKIAILSDIATANALVCRSTFSQYFSSIIVLAEACKIANEVSVFGCTMEMWK